MPSSDAPRVSVIIPCFNYGHFLKSCLASVKAQTLKSVETLIIDDGSTDPDTLKILYHLSEGGIKIIHQENLGLSGARNTGIRHARGEYVYFLDADDILFPDCLEKLDQLLQKNSDALAACCGVKLLGGEQDGTEWPARYHPYVILVENTWAAGIMLRKRRIEELSLWYDETMRNGYEDWEFNIRLVQSGQRIMVHPGALYHYRIHSNSMLASSRTQHLKLISYIREKHRDLFTAENLRELKQSNSPALAVSAVILECLAKQSFKDYVASENTNSIRYRLLDAGDDAVIRLPPEAIECAIVFLEVNKNIFACTLAVRLHENDSYLGSTWKREMCQPVAMIVKPDSGSAMFKTRENFASFENFILFSDQVPGSKSGWKPLEFNVDAKRKSYFRDPVSIRKLISAKIEKLFGTRIKNYLVSSYDFIYYRVLLSDWTFSVRNKAEGFLGKRGEIILSRIVYGGLLAVPPSKNAIAVSQSRQRTPDPAPLFFEADRLDSTKITLLIVTAWLNQGGIEQELLDLCTYLDRSRFKVLIATTRRSSHPWENRFRSVDVSIYHLADILSPHQIQRGLTHLILQHGVDVMHVVHSAEAYASLSFIKRLCPFIAVCDRNVILEGNFPKVSARLGAELIDTRTVGHHRLAKKMSDSYGLARATLKVVYAGTDRVRLERSSTGNRGLLHSLCGVSNDVPIILYLGRLDREKRPEIFVKVAARLRKMRPDCSAHFAMVGDGEMRGKTKSLIAKLALGNRVHLLGFQLNGHQLIRESSILMITSRYEGLALVSFEAMAVGTPQISADVGGQSELVTPDIGILIRIGIGEVERFTRACIELLDNRERRECMSAASKRKFTKQYTAEHCANQYSQLFDELAELSRRRAHEVPCLLPPHINPLDAFG
jgi:glycosyltransferase involved in cell wall biosynthesis/GT2 family glycosyltransferase